MIGPNGASMLMFKNETVVECLALVFNMSVGSQLLVKLDLAYHLSQRLLPQTNHHAIIMNFLQYHHSINRHNLSKTSPADRLPCHYHAFHTELVLVAFDLSMVFDTQPKT